jgi:energy-converting hydrogenase Eha subunit C
MPAHEDTRSWWSRLAAGVVFVGAGAVILLKLFLGKIIFLAVVWAGIVWAARLGGWLGTVVIVVIVLGAIVWGKAHLT